MVQSLFKKHSEFKKIDEILYCRITRFKYIKLGVFIQYQNTKAILKNKNMGQNRFKKLSKMSIKLFYFDLVKRGEKNSV